jgi:SHS2 domain-containing protein
MYRWVDHTGELELEIEGPDEHTVFEEAVAALHELIDDGSPETGVERRLELTAPDRATLLAELLTELIFHVETEDFVPVQLGSLELGRESLRATVRGHYGSPPHLVKAVTYHRLAFDRSNEAWHARVVLDV